MIVTPQFAVKHQSAGSACVVYVDAIQETSYYSNNISNETMDQTSSSVLSIASNYASGTSYANIKVYSAVGKATGSITANKVIVDNNVSLAVPNVT